MNELIHQLIVVQPSQRFRQARNTSRCSSILAVIATLVILSFLLVACTGSISNSGTSLTRGSGYPFSNKIILEDPLKDNSRGYQWSEFHQEASCYFSADAYHASTPGAPVPCIAQKADLLNFTYQVDMTIIKGEEGGIVFRWNEDEQGGFPHFGSFIINTNGGYKISAWNDYGIGFVIPKSSEVIKKGLNQSNTIAVVVHDRSITCYVNGQKIESMSGTDPVNAIPSAPGNIGVIANSMFTENPTISTEIAYRNAKVWEL